MLNPAALLEAVRRDFHGLDTRYPDAQGVARRRHYLDSAATTLMMGAANAVAQRYLAHYGSPHTSAHHAAQAAGATLDWARAAVLRFLSAPETDYACVFHGSGATAVLNRAARLLGRLRPERRVVLASLMEHHSNDLPHRSHGAQVRHVRLCPISGCIDLDDLERHLIAAPGQVNYVALTAASNVTGVVNPLAAAAELAHRHGALLVVDAAQAAAHMPLVLDGHDHRPDVLALSGHKIYAPGSPGVLVARRSLLQAAGPDEIGGGVVDDVGLDHYTLRADVPEREQAGTPDVLGALTLASALDVLGAIGMERIAAHEVLLLRQGQERLAQVPGVRLYGADASAARISCLSFNLANLPHALVATVLNDHYGIAVRSGCFCAHPYVAALLRDELFDLDVAGLDEAGIEQALAPRRGMVRASVGIYTEADDMEALADALADIGRRRDARLAGYRVLPDGRYRHGSAAAPLCEPAALLGQYLQGLTEQAA
jgi:selenocysteine lyase/cysteine desulfurase